MKNTFLRSRLPTRRFNFSHLSLIASLLLAVVAPLHSAHATPELDRQYSLTNIGILRAWDNVDGLFGEIVVDAYKRYLNEQPRFVVQDLSKANQILGSSSLPYNKLIEDPEVLGQIAKTLKLDSFIRTKVYKEGPSYRFVIDWIHAQKLQVIASETVSIEEPFTGEERRTQGSESFHQGLYQAMERLMTKIPFKGMVTGRDQTSITINIGMKNGIQKGDTVILSTIDEVKFHPLLKTLVDWRMTPTGRAVVDEVDEGMAFAKIDSEEFSRQIGRFQKVTQIIPPPERPNIVEDKLIDTEERTRESREPPRTGWIAPGLMFGNYSRETSNSTGSSGFTGAGFAIGAKAEGQVWFTSKWFGELDFAYLNSSYEAKNISTGAVSSSVSATMTQFRLSIGYFLHLTPNFFGPKGWFRAGYNATSFGLPNVSATQTSNVDYGGLFLGVGGDLPIREDYGAMMSVDVGLFGAGTEAGNYLGTTNGATMVDLQMAGYYWMAPKMKLKVCVDFKSYSLDFLSGSSMTNKVFAIGPQLQIHF